MNGGVLVAEDSMVFIVDCIARQNEAANAGGVLYAIRSSLDAEDTTFEQNKAK
jgi:hypothetical protein